MKDGADVGVDNKPSNGADSNTRGSEASKVKQGQRKCKVKRAGTAAATGKQAEPSRPRLNLSLVQGIRTNNITRARSGESRAKETKVKRK